MSFVVKINTYIVIDTYIDLNEEFYLVLKENKKNFAKRFHDFVDSELVKTCHEHIRSVLKLISYLSSPCFAMTF